MFTFFILIIRKFIKVFIKIINLYNFGFIKLFIFYFKYLVMKALLRILWVNAKQCTLVYYVKMKFKNCKYVKPHHTSLILFNL